MGYYCQCQPCVLRVFQFNCHLPSFSEPCLHLAAFVPERDEGRMLRHILDFSMETESQSSIAPVILPFSLSRKVHQVTLESAKCKWRHA
jgi:hypothetical protein